MLERFFYLPFIVGFILAQQNPTPPDSLQQVVQKFYSFYQKYPQQKMYVQTDRPYYSAGADLFGKIYLVNETAGTPSDSIHSKKIYVELIDEENKLVQGAVVNGLSGSLNFSFHLPDSLRAGNYLLRAYTSWMLHYGSSQVFSTYIAVLNRSNQLTASLSFRDSLLSTVTVQLKDTLQKVFANSPVSYQVLYKNKSVLAREATTDVYGKFGISLTKIPEQFRGDAVLSLKAGTWTKLLRLPLPNDAPDVQLLLEGGSLVNDISNTVAFKVVNKQGYGVDVEGFVEDSTKTILSTFKSAHLGMGKFSITPRSRQLYTVVLKWGDKLYRYPLEPANDYAYQVSVVKQTNDALTARVVLGDSLYLKNKTSYLIARSRGVIYFTSEGHGLYEVVIPLKNAPEGITQLALFDEAMQPVSERLVYVAKQQDNVEMQADKPDYEKRQKVTVQLKSKNADGKPAPGFYALSVTDDSAAPLDSNAATIKTHLMLSPYLQGAIEQPGYYFHAHDSIHERNLDLVMLTHGWSRFTWQNIMDGQMPTQPYTSDSSLTVSGTLLNPKGAPLNNHRIQLFSKTDNFFIGADTTDATGTFAFKGIDFTDSSAFFIHVTNAKGQNEDATVVINAQVFPAGTIERPLAPNNLTAAFVAGAGYQAPTRHDSVLNGMLKEVVLTAQRRKVDYDESRRVSALSYVIPPRIIQQFSNFDIMSLMYTVPGATFMNGHVSFYGLQSFGDSASPATDPMIVVDGVEAPRGGGIDLHEVEFVEVLRGAEAAIYGIRGGRGVIVVHTKQGKDAPVFYTKNGIRTLQVPGYHVERQFYTPRYETEESRFAKGVDARATIYWNGHVTTDKNGAATVTFYTADLPTTYTLTLEGITQNGTYIHQTTRINRTKF